MVEFKKPAEVCSGERQPVRLHPVKPVRSTQAATSEVIIGFQAAIVRFGVERGLTALRPCRRNLALRALFVRRFQNPNDNRL